MGRLINEQNETIGLTWSLSDPGMDLYERAGLAALYMTLRAVEEQVGDARADAVRDALEWNLSDHSVEIRWSEPKAAKEALTKLFDFAWRVNKDGVLYLPAVHRDPRQRDTYFLRLAEHNGILGTSLQGNIQKKEFGQQQIETIDEDKEFCFRFRPLKGKLAPQSSVLNLFNRTRLRDVLSTTAWVKPGIEPRFANTEKAWSGPADLALLLMLAPIASLYQQIQGDPGSTIQVVPDIRNLHEFNIVRPEIRLNPINATGPGDVALTFVADYASRSLRNESMAGCRVIAIGLAGYYHKSNKTKKGVEEVRPDQDTLSLYRLLQRVMASRFIAPQRDTSTPDSKRDAVRLLGYFRVPSARGRIADNLVMGRPWYTDLLEPPQWEFTTLKNRGKELGISPQRLWLQDLSKYQKGQIVTLIKHTRMTNDDERQFVEAMWDLLGAAYRRERRAVEKQYNNDKRISPDQFKQAWKYFHQHGVHSGTAAGHYLKRRANINDKLGRQFAQAKTQHLTAEVITGLMRLAVNEYGSSVIKNNPDVIRQFINDRRKWKSALHLARLALASYQPKNKRSNKGAS